MILLTWLLKPPKMEASFEGPGEALLKVHICKKMNKLNKKAILRDLYNKDQGVMLNFR